VEPKTYIDYITDFAWAYGPKILTALLMLIAG
jgi:hypothetical protein